MLSVSLFGLLLELPLLYIFIGIIISTTRYIITYLQASRPAQQYQKKKTYLETRFIQAIKN